MTPAPQQCRLCQRDLLSFSPRCVECGAKQFPRWLAVIDREARVVVEILDGNEAGQCSGSWGANPPCGGCTSCMVGQAEYAGYVVRGFHQREHETVGDAAGRALAEYFSADSEHVGRMMRAAVESVSDDEDIQW